MRVLALDLGDKRIGVAVSDPGGRVATPVAVLDAVRALGDGRDLKRLCEDYEPDRIVIGLPLSLDGSEGPQARHVRTLTDKLAPHLCAPVEFVDERLSSSDASRALHEAGIDSRKQRGRLDAVAASLFLQVYLDEHNRTGGLE